MERQKRRYYKKFVERTSQETLKEFSSFIEDNEKRLHSCYDVELIFEKDSKASKFMEIILGDAVFIIELFLRNFGKEADDFLFCRVWLSLELHTDLILLENQLPFFVLEDLYNLAFPTSDKPSFLRLACLYFDLEEDEKAFGGKEIKHFTDLIRCHLVKTLLSDSDSNSDSSSVETIDYMYSATMLREVGVKFKAVKDYLLNVKFDLIRCHLVKTLLSDSDSNSVETIDYMYSATMLREVGVKFKAVKDCLLNKKPIFVVNYIQLLDFLVDTNEDVDLLNKKGIIINEMGSSAAVADMINNLVVGVAELTLCYDNILKNLKGYHESYWNRTKGTLKHVYFNNLWRGTATIAAFIVGEAGQNLEGYKSSDGGGGVGGGGDVDKTRIQDHSHWYWVIASIAQFGWAISSYRKGYAGDHHLMPFKAFAVTSLFLGASTS
ncbi:hypothetical protein REPUB_Repub17cG0181000 [Reevesia pubescens]